MIEDLESRRMLAAYTIRPADVALDAALLNKTTQIPADFAEPRVFTPACAQSERLFASDSNADGLVVGKSYVYPRFHGYSSAFIWDGTRARELDLLVTTPGHWVLDSAIAINKEGQILVHGWNDQTDAGAGEYVLTPLDTTSTFKTTEIVSQEPGLRTRNLLRSHHATKKITDGATNKRESPFVLSPFWSRRNVFDE